MSLSLSLAAAAVLSLFIYLDPVLLYMIVENKVL